MAMHTPTRPSHLLTAVSRQLVRNVMAATCVGVSLGAASPSRAADVSGLSVLATLRGNDASFDYAAVDPAARRLYVARGDGVMSVDLQTLQITPRLVPGKRVHAVVPLPGDQLLATSGDTNTAILADARTGATLAEISVGDKPDAAVYDPVSKLAFVVDGRSGDLAVIDLATRAVATRIVLGGELEFAAVDGKGHVYVNVSDTPAIAVVDTRTLLTVARYSLPGCEKPSGLGIDPESGVLLSVCRNQTAIALHAADGTVIAAVGIDRIPDAAIFDRQRRMFFVPCGRDATLVAIAESTQGVSVVGRVPTAIGAHTGALDPQTGRLYLPAADFSFSFSGFKQSPGTFRVLIIGEK